MKKILLCLVAGVLLAGALTAQNPTGIQFEKGSLAAILKKAKAENKYVFVDVYTTWCPPCKYMAENVFTDKEVGKFFNSTFVNAKFDAEKGEGVGIAMQYGVRAYPTFLLLDGDGKLVGQMVGGSPAKDFINKFKELKAKADAQRK